MILFHGKFFEFKKAERGKKFIIKKAKDEFDLNLIENVLNDPDIKRNIEFNSKIVGLELKEQQRVKKRRELILDLIYLCIIIIILAFEQNKVYSIPFIAIKR